MLFWEVSINETPFFKNLEKAGPENPEDPFNKYSKILNMGSISSRRHELDILGNLEYRIKIFKKI